TLPPSGALELDDGAGHLTAVTAGQVLDASQIGHLLFVPSAHFTGTASFTWLASDGLAWAQNPANVSINFAPALSLSSATPYEGQHLTATLTLQDHAAYFRSPLVRYAFALDDAPLADYATATADNRATFISPLGAHIVHGRIYAPDGTSVDYTATVSVADA